MPLFSAHAQHGSQHRFGNVHLLSWANSCPWRAVGRVSFREATVIQAHSWINDELLWRQRLSFPRDTFANVKGLHMYGSTSLSSTPNKTTQDACTVYYLDARISASGITQMSAVTATHRDWRRLLTLRTLVSADGVLHQYSAASHRAPQSHRRWRRQQVPGGREQQAAPYRVQLRRSQAHEAPLALHSGEAVFIPTAAEPQCIMCYN